MRTKRDVREKPTNEKGNQGFQGLTLSSKSRRETDKAGRLEGRYGGCRDRTGGRGMREKSGKLDIKDKGLFAFQGEYS